MILLCTIWRNVSLLWWVRDIISFISENMICIACYWENKDLIPPSTVERVDRCLTYTTE